MRTAFPSSDYYRPSAPPRAVGGRRAFPADPPGVRDRGGSSGVVPTFTAFRSSGEAPLRHRHGYAAVLHRGLPTGKINPIQEFPPTRAVRTATQPRSTGFELAEVLRGFTPLVPRVHLPVSLAGPTPSGSAGASRRCRGCSPPDPVVSPDPAAPSFDRSAARGTTARASHPRTDHSASWRTVSHPHSTQQRLTAHGCAMSPTAKTPHESGPAPDPAS